MVNDGQVTMKPASEPIKLKYWYKFVHIYIALPDIVISVQANDFFFFLLECIRESPKMQSFKSWKTAI